MSCKEGSGSENYFSEDICHDPKLTAHVVVASANRSDKAGVQVQFLVRRLCGYSEKLLPANVTVVGRLSYFMEEEV